MSTAISKHNFTALRSGRSASSLIIFLTTPLSRVAADAPTALLAYITEKHFALLAASPGICHALPRHTVKGEVKWDGKEFSGFPISP
eukprot:jgi/Tetstr1/444497/TSEL_032376.t1